MLERIQLWWLDVAGGVLTVALLGAVVWLAAAPTRAAVQTVNRLDAEISTAKADLAGVRRAHADQQDRIDALQSSLDKNGNLPERYSLQSDLDTITSLVDRHHLSLAEVVPLSGTAYPGIAERRYRLMGEGRYADWLSFFQDFAAAQMWADIAYLSMYGPSTPSLDGTVATRAEMTVSFYSHENPGGGQP